MKRNKTFEKYLQQATNAYYTMGNVLDSIESNAVGSYHDGDITYDELQELRGMVDYYMGRRLSDE